jgi:hypothetical protein
MLTHENLAWDSRIKLVEQTGMAPKTAPSATCRSRTSPSRCSRASTGPSACGLRGVLRRVAPREDRGEPQGVEPTSSSACPASGRSSTPVISGKHARGQGRQGQDRRVGDAAWAARSRASERRGERAERAAPPSVPPRQQAGLLHHQAGPGPRSGAGLVSGAAPIGKDVLEFFAPRHHHPRGLRPVRGHRPHHVQPPRQDPLRHRRGGAARGRR